MKPHHFASIAIALALLLQSCVSSSPSSSGVQRVAADEVYDLTGKWNDIDSQNLAADMVDQVLNGGWLQRWEKAANPVVIIGGVRNNTSEHINTRLFIKDLEAELVNSGQVTFVASSAERGEIRGEREDQQDNASEETMKRLAQETGADYVLIGGIDSDVEETTGAKVIYYLASMELIHVQSNIKAWVGTAKTKKFIDKTNQSRRDNREQLNNDW